MIRQTALLAVQLKIFGFEMQDSSNFKISSQLTA